MQDLLPFFSEVDQRLRWEFLDFVVGLGLFLKWGDGDSGSIEFIVSFLDTYFEVFSEVVTI